MKGLKRTDMSAMVNEKVKDESGLHVGSHQASPDIGRYLRPATKLPRWRGIAAKQEIYRSEASRMSPIAAYHEDFVNMQPKMLWHSYSKREHTAARRVKYCKPRHYSIAISLSRLVSLELQLGSQIASVLLEVAWHRPKRPPRLPLGDRDIPTSAAEDLVCNGLSHVLDVEERS